MEIYGAEQNSVEAVVEVRVSPQQGYGFDLIARQISAHREVKSLYLMTGDYDFILILQGSSVDGIARFISEKISVYTSVITTSTRFILKRYKSEGAPYGGL